MRFYISAAFFIGLLVSFQKIGAAEKNIENPPITKSIAVEDITSDKQMEQRFIKILKALGSFEKVNVKVHSGIVILTGIVEEEDQIKWLENLAERLDGVVAVQNQLQTPSRGVFDFAPAQKELKRFSQLMMKHLPTIVLAVIMLLLSFFFFRISFSGFRRIFSKHISSPLLLNISAKLLSIPVFVLGLYLVLRISGLTGLAFTLIGGTSVIGLAIGLGLKDVFENYAASIFLSIKKPFRANDWVKIGDAEGIVQQVNTRTTLIMEFSGNHILIPNSIVYKSVIMNKSANSKMRSAFTIGIDYDDPIEEAQKLILDFLAKTPVVLKNPEPWVLVDDLASSSVKLKVYFWVKVREVSIFKVSSYILLEVKKLLSAHNFHFPDPQREIVFTNQLSFGRSLNKSEKLQTANIAMAPPNISELRSETADLNQQAEESDLPDQGKDLLNSDSDEPDFSQK